MHDRDHDLGLISGLVGGDSRAWGRFLDRFGRLIYAAIHRALAGSATEIVEDTFQEVCVRLCRNDFALLRSYDPTRARLTTWLTVIAKSTAIDARRKHQRESRHRDELTEQSATVDPPQSDHVVIPEGLLSGRQKLVLALLYERDLEVADVARLLNVEAQTVRSTHHKALTKLRNHFANMKTELD